MISYWKIIRMFLMHATDFGMTYLKDTNSVFYVNKWNYFKLIRRLILCPEHFFTVALGYRQRCKQVKRFYVIWRNNVLGMKWWRHVCGRCVLIGSIRKENPLYMAFCVRPNPLIPTDFYDLHLRVYLVNKLEYNSLKKCR